jgi:hypothetical protein
MTSKRRKWVREPGALLTILKLKALQVGDYVLERRAADMEELPWRLTSNTHVDTLYEVYSDDLCPLKYGREWTLVGWWRRPK